MENGPVVLDTKTSAKKNSRTDQWMVRTIRVSPWSEKNDPAPAYIDATSSMRSPADAAAAVLLVTSRRPLESVRIFLSSWLSVSMKCLPFRHAPRDGGNGSLMKAKIWCHSCRCNGLTDETAHWKIRIVKSFGLGSKAIKDAVKEIAWGVW